MKIRFRLSILILALLLALSACDGVDLDSSDAAPAGQPAVSVAQRQRSILTPVVDEVNSGGVTEESQSVPAKPSSTVSVTQSGDGQDQQNTPTITLNPTLTTTTETSGLNTAETSTNTPVPATATVQIQPTNTRVPPTPTFTSTTIVQPSLTFTPTNEPTGGGSSTSCDASGNSSFEAQVISLINQERSARGLSAYSSQSQLTSAARTHSDDMACNNFFSHTSPTTGSPFDRIAAAGYSYSWAGENIAAGYGTPAAVVEGWMNSDGHRNNILSENFTQIGVGYAYWGESDYGAYWTAVFASP